MAFAPEAGGHRMDRRNFLRTAGLSVAAISLPGWMQACGSHGFEGLGGLPAFDGQPRSTDEALARAKALGRPLLVFVVPENPFLTHDRGDLLGVYINRSDVEPMADLALCEIWCAKPAEIRARIAPDLSVDDASLAVIVEADGKPPVLVTGEVPPEGQPFTEGWHDETVRVKRAKARNQFLFERLHAVIAADAAMIERRSKLACARVFDKTTAKQDHVAVPNAQLAEQVPAWVRLRAETYPETRTGCMELLSDVAIRRWRAVPPPRTQWARSHGCGVEIEGDTEGLRVACGMGYTPEFSSRFLTFLTEEKG